MKKEPKGGHDGMPLSRNILRRPRKLPQRKLDKQRTHFTVPLISYIPGYLGKQKMGDFSINSQCTGRYSNNLVPLIPICISPEIDQRPCNIFSPGHNTGDQIFENEGKQLLLQK